MATSSIDDSGATAVDRYSWTYLGSLRTDTGGGLVFPPVAAEPGIYRFLIEDGMQPVAGYIGQAKRSLATRFGLYRSRGKKPKLPLDQKTTSRIAARLLHELASGRHVRVEFVEDLATYPDGRVKVLDFTDKVIRASVERQAILELCETGIEVLNRDGNPQWEAPR